MQAPVKLLFPLIAFIVPCTFVVLGLGARMTLELAAGEAERLRLRPGARMDPY